MNPDTSLSLNGDLFPEHHEGRREVIDDEIMVSATTRQYKLNQPITFSLLLSLFFLFINPTF